MKKVILTFGFISGAIVVALMYITMPFHEKWQDLGLGEVIGYTTMLLAFSAIYFGVKSLRDNQLGGNISFVQALATGLCITAVASIMYGIGWEVYMQISDGNFMEEYATAQLRKMNERGASAEEIDKFQADMKMWATYYKNPILRFLLTLMEILPVGLLVSIISAAILRRKEVQPTATV